MSSLASVFVIDSDPVSRIDTCAAIQTLGIHVIALTSPNEFLAGEYHREPGCVMFEIHSNSSEGIDLLHELANMNSTMPVIFISSNEMSNTVVEAMRAGALNYLIKPCSIDQLQNAITEAFHLNAQYRLTESENEEMSRRMNKLTNSEIRALEMVIIGRPNKVVAKHMNVSQRTVERMRSSIIKKIGVQTTAEVVHHVTKFRTLSDNNRTMKVRPHFHLQATSQASMK